MKWAMAVTHSDKNEQLISASGDASLPLPDHLFVYFFKEKPEIWIFK